MLQLIYLTTFLFADPMPYMEYRFLSILKYFHLMFLPQILPSIYLNNSHYAVFTEDVSFLANSPVILVFIFVGMVYLLTSFLSSKRFITNKSVRKLFKKIRKYRMRYGLIHDAFWVCYLYVVFISVLQFKMGDFSSTNAILNMMLAIITFLIFLSFTIVVVYLGIKYRHTPDKIPRKYSFLVLEPSAQSLEMPMRYIRKLLFCLCLLFSEIQSQAIALLAVNILFVCFFGCYKPAKSSLTNKVVLLLELGLILLLALFLAYDKTIVKDTSAQQGYSIAMVTIECIIILIAMVWCCYRLILVIRETETWKKIYSKCTENTDPDYLKEQQRKRDLEFDFGSLENRSQD